jgi:hypothetical protein
MAVSIITVNPNQASVIAASEELASLPLYASMGHDVMARALELTKVWLPAELHESIDAILNAQAMAGSEYVVSVREREVA